MCDEDPCRNATCPRFLNAQCLSDNCSGTCTARFFHFKGHEVTDNCDVVDCIEKECPAGRICVEQVQPSSCPDENRQCRQFIQSRCELPSDCTQIQCPIGMVCVVEETRRGPVARCRSPTSCDQLQCDEGMECFQRDRDGKPPVVRCVPIKLPPFPRDCRAVTCPSGMTCMLFGRPDKPRARCVILTCELLNCESSSSVCRETSEGPRCERPQSCDELNCPGGLICVEALFFGPQCVPPEFGERCADITCGANQRCVTWEFLERGFDDIAFCYPTDLLRPIESGCTGNICEIEFGECVRITYEGDMGDTANVCGSTVDFDTLPDFENMELLIVIFRSYLRG